MTNFIVYKKELDIQSISGLLCMGRLKPGNVYMSTLHFIFTANIMRLINKTSNLNSNIKNIPFIDQRAK